MFTGEYNHTIDAKGRIIVPAKYRDELGSVFVVTVGLDGCLFIYTKERWDDIAERIGEVPGKAKVRNLQRCIMSSAEYVEVDKQGRILIPIKLRKYAALEKDVVFAGINKKIEVWNKDRWDEINNFSDINEAAEQLAEFGITF